MTPGRRGRPLLAVVLVAVVVLSGCSALLGDEPVRYTATEAGLCGSTAAETGYVIDDSGWRNVTRDVEAAGGSKTLYVENYLNGYVHEVPVENGSGTELAGGIAVLSTPQAAVAGQALNPVGSWSPRRLVEEFSDEFDGYGELAGLEETGTYDVTTLESETTVTTFAAQGQRDDESVPVRVHVTRIPHAGDYVVVGAVHERGDAEERRRVERLFGCIEHAEGAGAGSTPQPSVSTSDQQSAGRTVTVDSVSLPDGGFVVLHDGADLAAGDAVGSVVGTSQYLSAGQHADVAVVLDRSLSSGTTRLVAMPHNDTDGDLVADFVPSNGREDEPYVLGGAPVTDDANVTVPTPTTTTAATTTTTVTTTSATPATSTTAVPTSTTTTTTTTTTTVPGSSTDTPGQPGFGAIHVVTSMFAILCLVVARHR